LWVILGIYDGDLKRGSFHDFNCVELLTQYVVIDAVCLDERSTRQPVIIMTWFVFYLLMKELVCLQGFHFRVWTDYAQGSQTSCKVRPSVNIDAMMQ
jgi:uncharacterized membrane protein